LSFLSIFFFTHVHTRWERKFKLVISASLGVISVDWVIFCGLYQAFNLFQLPYFRYYFHLNFVKILKTLIFFNIKNCKDVFYFIKFRENSKKNLIKFFLNFRSRCRHTDRMRIIHFDAAGSRRFKTVREYERSTSQSMWNNIQK
jgi:hypothetical protein